MKVTGPITTSIDFPAVVSVSDGVLSIPLPMPGRTMPYSLCYAIEDTAGDVHVIDAGMAAEGNWDALVRGLAVGGISIDRIATVTITHLHHDHAGLAARIRAATGAAVGMHVVDAATMAEGLSFADPLRPDEILDCWGVPRKQRTILRPVAERKVAIGQPVTIDTPLRDGDQINMKGRTLEVVHTPGHTPGQIVLHDRDAGLVFTGDHLLPSAFPGIGLGGHTHDAGADPIADYLNSLDILERLGASLALPGHEHLLARPATRIAHTRAHHLRRSGEVATLLEQDPKTTVWEVARRIPWSTAWNQLTGVRLFSAISQTDLHIRHLTGIDITGTR